MAVTATVRASIAAQLTSTLDLGSGTASQLIELVQSFEDGVGAGQVNQAWGDTRTIAASGTDDLDLNGAALTNAFGVAIAFVRVKAIAVKAASGNANNVIVGGAAATQFVGPFGAATHTIAIAPGGAFLIVNPTAAGWTVGAGASDLLRIANGGAGTPVTYDIAILGGLS